MMMHGLTNPKDANISLGRASAHNTVSMLLVDFTTDVTAKFRWGLSLLRSMKVNELSTPNCTRILRMCSTHHSAFKQNIMLQFIVM
jgi:hypothetical protein